VSGQQVDAGGSATSSTSGFSIHGGRVGDGRVSLDGITLGQRGSSGGVDGAINLSMYQINVGAAQETVISTAGGLGEAESSGLAINVVPREGGNTHRGSIYGTYSSGAFQSSNYTAGSIPGLRSANQLERLWRSTPRKEVHRQGQAVAFPERPVERHPQYDCGHTTTERRRRHEVDVLSDLNRQAIDDTTYKSLSLRLTVQPTPKDKIGIFWDEQDCKTAYIGGGSATTSPEAPR
jgi:hypothetical protein